MVSGIMSRRICEPHMAGFGPGTRGRERFLDRAWTRRL